MRSTNTTTATAALLLVGGLALAGCTDGGAGSTGGETHRNAQPSATSDADRTPDATATPSGSAASARTEPALTAIGTAEGAVSGGTVFDLESDSENGTRLWEVKVADESGRQFDLELSADGTSVTRKKEDRTPDDDVAKLKKAKITLRDAIATAADRAPGRSALTAAEIDTDRGRLVWQVSFGGDDGDEVLVDAASGAVVRAGRDVG